LGIGGPYSRANLAVFVMRRRAIPVHSFTPFQLPDERRRVVSNGRTRRLRP